MLRKRRTAADEPFLLVRTQASDHAGGTATGRHAHDWHQLIHAASGVLTVWTERGSWIAPPHWAIWVPAGIAHEIRFGGDCALRTLWLRPGWSQDLPGDCTVAKLSPLLRELILRACRDGMLDARDPVEAAVAGLILDEFRQGDVAPFDLPQPESAALRRAAALIGAGAPEARTIASLARSLGLSVRTLERRFVAETGLSLGRWRRNAALLAAMQRLALGESVKRAAATAGYAAPSAFVAAFREVFGATPGRYFAADAAPS